jgi:hypothetical protein
VSTVADITCEFEHPEMYPEWLPADQQTITCNAAATHIVYQELGPEDIGEENPFDMLGVGTVFVCDAHKDITVQEILADGIAPDVGLFVIKIANIEQVR